jgi:hypothetical protein
LRHWFACEIEEIVKPGDAKSPRVRRLDRGFARTDGRAGTGFAIEAASEPFDDTLRALETTLEGLPGPAFSRLPDNVSARMLTRTTAVSRNGATFRTSMRVVSLTRNAISIIATRESLTGDLATLSALARREPVERVLPSSLPMAWQEGSAAVLIHEAVGHPAERGIFAPSVPSWLRVDDSPETGHLVRLETDDTGTPVGSRTLTDGLPPDALRRWSHRDIPARRMTNLIVRGSGRPVTRLPSPRVDVLLASAGQWDPLTDEVSVKIAAADLVDGPHRRPVEPFTWSIRRAELFRLLAGWFGEVHRHPGVLCGDEGVALPVGSAAVGLMTEAT